MNIKQRHPLILFVMLVISASCSVRHELVIEHVEVIDVVSGHSERRTIGIDDNKITTLSTRPLNGKTVIDALGFYAIPGLWDMHVHISDPVYFDLFVANGVVGVRDMGGDLQHPDDGCSSVSIELLRQWQSEIKNGKRIGPKIVMSGPVVSGRKWPKDHQEKYARQAVQEAVNRSADFIKIYEDISSEGFAVIIEEAQKHQLPVAGHVSEETLTVTEAIVAGQRSIEHVRGHLLVCYAQTDDELAYFFEANDWTEEGKTWGENHRKECDKVWALLKSEPVWLGSTLPVEKTWIDGAEAGFAIDSRRKRLPQSVIKAAENHATKIRETKASQKSWLSNKIWWQAQLAFVLRAKQEEVRLLSGSDSACEGVIPGYSIHDQLGYLVEAGFTPLEAIRTATIEPAAYFGKEGSTGQVAAGFDANFILIRQDPREDISATRQIEAVILNGQYLNRDQLLSFLHKN